jgi:hypothetical protein
LNGKIIDAGREVGRVHGKNVRVELALRVLAILR